MRYARNIAISLDQLLNTILAGEPDETLSSRAHRMRVKGQRYWSWTAGAIDLLWLVIFREKDHCHASYESELRRAQMPKEFHV